MPRVPILNDARPRGVLLLTLQLQQTTLEPACISIVTYKYFVVQPGRVAQDLAIKETYIPSGTTTDEGDEFSLKTVRPALHLPSERSEVSSCTGERK